MAFVILVLGTMFYLCQTISLNEGVMPNTLTIALFFNMPSACFVILAIRI